VTDHFAIDLLSKLVAIDSVNPSLVPGAAGEAAIAKAIAGEMTASGLAVQITEAAPGRPNVVGVLEGRLKGRSLLYLGHTDTVGVAAMQAPFSPIRRDGRLYGRGSQDMKGGLAAMLGAARQLAAFGLEAGRLIVAAVIDEEYASLGTECLLRSWKADGAVVIEPTDLAPVIAHRGFACVEVTTYGRAAHGSRPADGRNAIFRMGRVLSELEKLDRKLQQGMHYPLLGRASLHPSLVNGGRELFTSPDRCTTVYERRTISREEANLPLLEIAEIIAKLKEDDKEFEADFKIVLDRSPLMGPKDHRLLHLLQAELSRAGRMAEAGGLSFWTDAALLAAAGIPAVVFGPGGAGLHSNEEYVIVDDVLVCQDVLAGLAAKFCC
jgi:acetylornithine deacetylase